MSTRVLTRWLAFVAYVTGFLTAPLAVLWGDAGAVVGLILSATFLLSLVWDGSERIAHRLGVRRVARAQAPELFAMVEEYSRRLQMAPPKVGIIESQAINLALFGFSRDRAWISVTRGALQTLRREELSALVGRLLCQMWYRDYIGESWLAQFLAVLDRLVNPVRTNHGASVRRAYPFRLFLRQTVLYPLTIVPAWLLSGGRDAAQLDVASSRVTRKPFALAEGLRRAECLTERAPLKVPFSARHLFLVTPVAQDPLVGVFFGSEELGTRIRHIQANLIRVVEMG